MNKWTTVFLAIGSISSSVIYYDLGPEASSRILISIHRNLAKLLRIQLCLASSSHVKSISCKSWALAHQSDRPGFKSVSYCPVWGRWLWRLWSLSVSTFVRWYNCTHLRTVRIKWAHVYKVLDTVPASQMMAGAVSPWVSCTPEPSSDSQGGTVLRESSGASHQFWQDFSTLCVPSEVDGSCRLRIRAGARPCCAVVVCEPSGPEGVWRETLGTTETLLGPEGLRHSYSSGFVSFIWSTRCLARGGRVSCSASRVPSAICLAFEIHLRFYLKIQGISIFIRSCFPLYILCVSYGI